MDEENLYKYAQNHGARTHYQLDIDGSSVTTVELETQQQRELSEKRKGPKLQTPQPFPLAPRSGNTRRLYPHMMKRRDLSREEIMEANIRVHQLFQKMRMMN